MTDSIETLEPGTRLGGKYQITGSLGHGGMGSVYKAENVEIGLKVAIKHLHPEFSRNKSVIERFRQEARLAASIGHANICEVIDFGYAENNTPFLVMPQLIGQTLSDVLSESQLPPNRICDILSQTLSGLQAAHDAKIVHRDLKPDNIFITKLGDRADFVKILDFGISKILDQQAEGLTQTGSALGTPYYMSPEQARGERYVDHRTDIWAIGVILFEALAGARPFTARSLPAILNKICNEPLPSLREYNPNVPPILEQVVVRALCRDMEARFQSAVAMQSALNDAVAQSAGPMGTALMPAKGYSPEGAATIPPEETGMPHSMGQATVPGKLGAPSRGSIDSLAVSNPSPRTLDPFVSSIPQAPKRSPWLYIATALIIVATGAGILALWISKPAEPEPVRLLSPQMPIKTAPSAPLNNTPTPRPTAAPTPEPKVTIPIEPDNADTPDTDANTAQNQINQLNTPDTPDVPDAPSKPGRKRRHKKPKKPTPPHSGKAPLTGRFGTVIDPDYE